MIPDALPLTAERYVQHALHQPGCAWVEKNCYTDVWIEVVHAAGLEPLAMLGYTLAVDFEGDQWTFFKPPPHALSRLYGIDVFELNVWRNDVLTHAEEQLAAGRLVFTEADAWWLPDTRGTDYRSQHTKSTIVINSLDRAARKLGYFHNCGYYGLEGEDFVNLFRLDFPKDPAFMPLFAEFARLDRLQRYEPAALAQVAVGLLCEQLQRAPVQNPVRRFAARFLRDTDWLVLGDLKLYHAYAFAGVRQLGAAFELAARHLEWLGANGEGGLETAATACAEISGTAKAILLKTARMAMSKRKPDFSELLESLAQSWDLALGSLRRRYA